LLTLNREIFVPSRGSIPAIPLNSESQTSIIHEQTNGQPLLISAAIWDLHWRFNTTYATSNNFCPLRYPGLIVDQPQPMATKNFAASVLGFLKVQADAYAV
jgi:hypothetical protein